MKPSSLFTLAVLASTGCAVDDAPPTAALDQAISTECPDWGCGVNSPKIDNSFFHELSPGRENLEGWTLGTGRKGTAIYDITVEEARIIARFKLGTVDAPRTLTGSALAGLEIALSRRNLATGNVTGYTMKISSVAHVAEFRANPTDGSTPPLIETYKLFISGNNSQYGAYLCQDGDLLPQPGPAGMPLNHALVFEGERINAQNKTIAPLLDNRWFNIGCAESAVAKLHLYGHTKAASHAHFVTSIAERQTMLKMLVADYCGTGKPFTVAGQPLDWRDDRGTMTLPSDLPVVAEARWRPEGPACLNTPRVDAHPSDASRAAFPEGIEAAIAAECPRPPACSIWDTTYHLRSYNRTPFTN